MFAAKEFRGSPQQSHSPADGEKVRLIFLPPLHQREIETRLRSAGIFMDARSSP